MPFGSEPKFRCAIFEFESAGLQSAKSFKRSKHFESVPETRRLPFTMPVIKKLSSFESRFASMPVLATVSIPENPPCGTTRLNLRKYFFARSKEFAFLSDEESITSNSRTVNSAVELSAAITICTSRVLSGISENIFVLYGR